MLSEKLCPACQAPSEKLINWDYSGLDASVFNYTAHWYHCKHCGLVYVDNINDTVLANFYIEECSYFENDHFDITSPENVAKYQHYQSFLTNAGLDNVPIADIGCGRGGFLQWLNNHGWKGDCVGVDVDIKSIPTERQSSENAVSQLSFQTGGALSLPFKENSQRLLTYYHVFEHIKDIDSVLTNAHQVLMNEGYLLIEVPDAENYLKQPVGSAFWMGIREHIYHYSAQSLSAALFRHGFEVVTCQREMLPTPEFEYPSLMILAKKTSSPNPTSFEPVGDIAEYVLSANQDIDRQAQQITKLAQQHAQLTFWGLSTQLFSLLPKLTGLQFNLCDASQQKQQCQYHGQSIMAPSAIKPEGVLVIAPYLHAEKIEKVALSSGWSPEYIYRLS